MRYYAAIPDIHGCKDHLEKALKFLDERDDIEKIFFTGDYVDRGPDSPGVLDVLIGRDPAKNMFIRGNHDQMMLEYLDYPTGDMQWPSIWGLQTIRQFGDRWKPGGIINSPEMRPYSTFIRNTRFFYETEHYIFVHAGINPFKPMMEQDIDNMMWARNMFCYENLSKLVVTGHSIVEQPTMKNNHLALDVGCYARGSLYIALLPVDGDLNKIMISRFS
jgi:serine/threonine protein phosphatase 1